MLHYLLVLICCCCVGRPKKKKFNKLKDPAGTDGDAGNGDGRKKPPTAGIGDRDRENFG